MHGTPRRKESAFLHRRAISPITPLPPLPLLQHEEIFWRGEPFGRLHTECIYCFHGHGEPGELPETLPKGRGILLLCLCPSFAVLAAFFFPTPTPTHVNMGGKVGRYRLFLPGGRKEGRRQEGREEKWHGSVSGAGV